ncbi:hypothetical protein D3C85_1122540 [compost metagenome]
MTLGWLFQVPSISIILAWILNTACPSVDRLKMRTVAPKVLSWLSLALVCVPAASLAYTSMVAPWLRNAINLSTMAGRESVQSDMAILIFALGTSVMAFKFSRILSPPSYTPATMRGKNANLVLIAAKSCAV